MKRFISVLSGLLVLPAFAEVAPVYYDDVIEYTDDMVAAEDSVESGEQKNVQQRANINRSTATSRAVPTATNASSRTNTASRAVASSPRTATTGASRGTVARTAKTTNVTSRTGGATRTAVTSRAAQTPKANTARVGVYGNIMSGARTDGATVNVLENSGTNLYNSRIGVANRRAAARLSTPVISATTNTTPTITQEEVTSTTNNLAAIAELTDYCKAQYAACMDNYCNVLDDNQGRCSCSKNIKNYEKTEQALAQATEDFQNVVQQIRYIGLTSDQVESLFAETEAELSMKSNSDSSRLKTSLDAIKKKIVDVSTPSATSTVTSGISLDLNGLLTADFSAGFDLNSFLNMNNNTTSSVSNQRGEQLYKTAANRCKTAVLNSCAAQGIEANIITNAYDLEIDKQCVLYERSLNDANAEMKSNVTNAATILQQARLLLAQNRNSYDLRSCIAAIDSCMQDEYVCGSDYELCLDPTGKYLANGEIVKGGTPGVSGGQNKNETPITSSSTTYTNANATPQNITTQTLNSWYSGGMYNLYSTWNYTQSAGASNAWSIGPNENLGQYVDYYLTDWAKNYKKSEQSTKTDSMATYLLQKIGYIDENDKVHGMCASAMKQCQDYTFSTKKNKKTYIPDNEVIRQYLNSTLAKIKIQQDAIIADYAESCRADVQSCLSTNGYEESNTSNTASKTAINACAAEITTCMSVGGYQVEEGVKLTLRAMTDWVNSILLTCGTNEYLSDDATGVVECKQCPSVLTVVDFNGAMTEVYGEDDPYAPIRVFVSVPGDDDSGSLSSEISADSALLLKGKKNIIPMVSSGGRIGKQSCSCPEGYTDYKIKSTDLVGSLPGYEVGSKVCIDDSVECGSATVNGVETVSCTEK